MSHKSTGSYIRMENNNLGFDFIITNLEKGVLNIILADPILGLLEVSEMKKENFFKQILLNKDFKEFINGLNNLSTIS
jgi:hypothetical protein